MYFHDLHTIRCYMYLTQETRIYGLGVGISSFRKILALPVLRGNGTTMYGHDLHTIRCYLTLEKRIYMV
jgi:hypothetical protein